MSPHPFDDAWSHRPARPATSPDVRLTCDVIERILDDPRLRGEKITVEVQNRVVRLLGTVSSLQARIAAADLARTTPGVTDICNGLELRRTADVTAAMADLRPDPFDELIAHWDDDRDGRLAAARRRGASRLLTGAAALATAVTGVLWLVLLPRFAGRGLIVVLPCAVLAVVLAMLAGHQQAVTSADRPAPPD